MSPARAAASLLLFAALPWGTVAAQGSASTAAGASAADESSAAAEVFDEVSGAAVPLDPAAQALLDARVLAERGDYAGAERRLRGALAELPDHHDLVFGVAQVLRWSGQTERALAQLDVALLLAPQSLDALTARGEILGQRGDFAAARAVLRRLEEIDAPPAIVDGLALRLLITQGRTWDSRRQARRIERDHGPSALSRAALRSARGVRIGATTSIELRQPAPRFEWGAHTHLAPTDRVRLWLAYAGSTWLGDQEHGLSGGLHLVSTKGLSFIVGGGGAWPGHRVARAQGQLGFGVRTHFKLELDVGLELRLYGAGVGASARAGASTVFLGRLGARQPISDRVAVRWAVLMAFIGLAGGPPPQPAPGASFALELKPHARVTIELGYGVATELSPGPAADELVVLLIHRLPASVDVQCDARFNLKVGASLEILGTQRPFPRVELLPTLNF